MYAQMLIGQGKDVRYLDPSRLPSVSSVQSSAHFHLFPQKGSTLSSLPWLSLPPLLSSLNSLLNILLVMILAVTAVELRKLNKRHRRNSVDFVPLQSQQLFTALLKASWLGDHRLRPLRELGGTIKMFSPVLSVGAPTSYYLHQLRCLTRCKPRECMLLEPFHLLNRYSGRTYRLLLRSSLTVKIWLPGTFRPIPPTTHPRQVIDLCHFGHRINIK